MKDRANKKVLIKLDSADAQADLWVCSSVFSLSSSPKIQFYISIPYLYSTR